MLLRWSFAINKMASFVADPWVREPTRYFDDAVACMEDAEAGSHDEALIGLLLRMVRVLLRRRYVANTHDVAAFLKRVLCHVVFVLDAAATAGLAAAAALDKAKDDRAVPEAASSPGPTPTALLEAARIVELALEPARELYLFGGATYRAPRRDARVGVGSTPPAAAEDNGAFTPPMLVDIMNAFAESGGFGAAARCVGVPGALPLPACGVLLCGAPSDEPRTTCRLHPRRWLVHMLSQFCVSLCRLSLSLSLCRLSP